MDVLEALKTLGRAMQEDDRYLRYRSCRENNDKDLSLTYLTNKLQEIQNEYRLEEEKETPDREKLKKYNAEFEDVYSEVMMNENMREFEDAKNEMDSLLNYMMSFLSLVASGEDPETAQPDITESYGCTGSCGSCGGCS